MGRRDHNIRSLSFSPWHVYHGVSVLSSGASMLLATARLINLQAHPGGHYASEKILNNGDLGGASRRFPVLAHNPHEHSFSWDSRRARSLSPLPPPLTSLPSFLLDTKRLKLLSFARGSPLYIFRYKFGHSSRSRLNIDNPGRSLYGRARWTSYP